MLVYLFIYFVYVIRYIDQFSRCLYVEYKKSGIDVQCQVLCFFILHYSVTFNTYPDLYVIDLVYVDVLVKL
jgi:hypothetical protein